MTDSRHTPDTDDVLIQHYRQHSSGEPPASLDAFILDAARREAPAPPPSLWQRWLHACQRPRWQMAFATVAGLALMIGVVTRSPVPQPEISTATFSALHEETAARHRKRCPHRRRWRASPPRPRLNVRRFRLRWQVRWQMNRAPGSASAHRQRCRRWSKSYSRSCACVKRVKAKPRMKNCWRCTRAFPRKTCPHGWRRCASIDQERMGHR